MLRSAIKTAAVMALVFGLGTVMVSAQNVVIDNDQDPYYYADRPAIDRYLSAEVWTDHSDAEYYSGDNVTIYFRANRDAFIAIYSIDSRGMVNLLFPAREGDDNFVRGGVTYSLPGPDDDYDLVLSGPQGDENIQIVASREQFPIPNWYHNSGLTCDWDSRNDYMDYLNGRYFVRYDGQRFAYDRAVIFVNEWEPDYFRPIYYPAYPSWSVCGNAYIDYPWGSSIYINGIYWGCAPMYVPRLLVGWHTITVYDRWGYCWESDFHVSRYHTVVFDKTIIHTSPTVASKYKEVRTVGYRDPVKAGYTKFYDEVNTWKSERSTGKVVANTQSGGTVSKQVHNEITKADYESFTAPKKRYVEGDGKLVKGDRGYETSGVEYERTVTNQKTTKSSTGSSRYETSSKQHTIGSDEYESSRGSSGKTSKSSSNSGSYDRSSSSSKSSSSDSYYRKQSGSTQSKTSKSSGRTTTTPKVDKKSSSPSQTGGSSNSRTIHRSPSTTKSSGNSGGGTLRSQPSQGKSSGSSSGSSKPSGSSKSSSNSSKGKKGR